MDLVTVVRHRPIAFALACMAALAMVFVSEGSYRRSTGALAELDAMEFARTRIQGLERSILNAETGQRGYLLTGRGDHLEPYLRAIGDIGESFRALDRYYAGQDRPARVLGELHALTESKLSELALTIRLHDEGKAAASHDLVLSDIGKEQMEGIHRLGDELLQHEADRVTAGRGELFQTLRVGRVGMEALSAISLLALLLYLRQTFALKRQQQEQQRLVQAERDRLEIEVSQRTAQLTELTHHLQSAREDERGRLARNLHDELGALLTSAKLDAARIRSRLAGTAPEALEHLAHLVGTLDSSIALGRRIIEDLRPSTLSNLGLVATLDILAREFAERSGLEVQGALEPVSLEADAELVVYRVVQEAITNISKYAKARHVWIGLAAREGRVEVSVRDDGVGFDPSAKPSSAYGLVGMRFRVEAEGGVLSVVSAPGQGTVVRMTLPQSLPVDEPKELHTKNACPV